MTREPAVAVIDIGKSNAKLALIDQRTRGVLSIRTTAIATVNDGAAYPHYDVETLWRWLIEGLRVFSSQADITTISVTTHGACFVLLAGDRLALPVLDYEYSGPEEVQGDYHRARGRFSEILSPELPNGLNAGRQLYWQRAAFPEDFARADTILAYPQYWVWRLTGEKTTEVTSLGCHTDLWNPLAGTYSALARREGWDRLFPPVVKAWNTVGTILPGIAKATGLSPSCRVVAGIHDSNASLYPHLIARTEPFAVLSTGTWMVVFAPGGRIDRLEGDRDCLANVDAFGRAVPSSRFMAGREYGIVADGAAEPTESDVARVVADRVMALPTFAPGTGPFREGRGRWSGDPSRLSPGERAAVASLYAALVTDTCLKLAGADGPVIVEGPFAKNRTFLAALAQIVPRPIIARLDATGTSEGAALLAAGPNPDLAAEHDPPRIAPSTIDLSEYVSEWRQQTK